MSGVQAGLPDGVGVGVVVPLLDRGDRAPEAPELLLIPAVDHAVCPGQVQHPEEPGFLGEGEPFGLGDRAERAVEQLDDIDGVELGHRLLLGGTRIADADGRAPEVLHLVVFPRVGVALERARAVRPELRRALEDERIDVGHPCERVADERRQGRTPLAGVGPDRERERHVPAVVRSLFEHCRGRGGPGRDPIGLVGAAGNVCERVDIERVESIADRLRQRRHEPDSESDEHVVRGGRNRGLFRC